MALFPLSIRKIFVSFVIIFVTFARRFHDDFFQFFVHLACTLCMLRESKIIVLAQIYDGDIFFSNIYRDFDIFKMFSVDVYLNKGKTISKTVKERKPNKSVRAAVPQFSEW